MKLIEDKVKPFTPVTIRLVTQEEVNLVAAMFGALSPSIRDSFGVEDTYHIYQGLDKKTTKPRGSLAFK